MFKLKISGTEFDADLTWAKFKKINQQYSAGVEGLAIGDIIIKNIWLCLRRGLIFKPFFFGWRLANKLSPSEVQENDKRIAEAMKLEGRESGN